LRLAGDVVIEEGLRAMWNVKLIMTAALLGTAAVGVLVVVAVAQADERRAEPKPDDVITLSAKVVAVAKDAKTFTLEIPSNNRRESTEPTRLDVHITDKTEVNYRGVGLNGAKPTEGYQAVVTLEKGSKDVAAKVGFSAIDPAREGVFVGRVVTVAKDGKSVTVEVPARNANLTTREVILPDKSKITYAYVAKDAAKPTEDYRAEVWFEERGSDNAVKVHFVDPKREKDFIVAGKLTGVAKDGNSFKLEVLPQVRGEDGKNVEVKIAGTTEFSFAGVGPNEAKLTEGYQARVWLQDSDKNTAAKIFLFKAGEGRGERR